ncbi:MAG: IclR family transcriptional regulator [Microbacteriaceae bacterium]
MADTLQSVRQALRILNLLQAHEQLGVSEVSLKLDIGPSSAHRILATLHEANFVRQNLPSRKYRLGPAMTGSRNAAAIEHCSEVAEPYLADLRDITGETVHLAARSGITTKFVAVFESNHVMRVTSRMGTALPAHTTSAGKVLLAELPDAELDALYPIEALPKATAQTLPTRSALKAELKQINTLGYATNRAESEPDVVALAMPVSRPAGARICAVTVTGPASRMNPDRSRPVCAQERDILDAMREHIDRIQAKLSY